MRCRKTPYWATEIFTHLIEIQKGITHLMALVQIDQITLDTLATSLEAVKTSLASEIAGLQVALPAADLTGLNQALADLQSLEAPAPTS